jgi:peptidoglycan/xylan/chitin deacetylase (PgdA/CDA1 family)
MTKFRRYPFYEEARRALLAKYARPMSFNWPGGVISFTFDDFPKSAFSAGDPLLSRYKVRATYFVAMGLAGTSGISGPMFDVRDVADVYSAGHEIACHTFTHPDCRAINRDRIALELQQNADAIAAAVGQKPANFAYPYGSVGATAKDFLQKRFLSCRGVGRAINYQLIDLADLFAVPIFAHEFNPTAIRQMIDFNVRVGGWLIFFTHDVTDAPSEYGCTPEQLDFAISYSSAQSRVLAIRDVMEAPEVSQNTPRTSSITATASLGLQKISRRYSRVLNGRADPASRSFG